MGALRVAAEQKSSTKGSVKMANCKDCVCDEVCYYKAFNDEKHLKKRRDDVEKICKSFVHRDRLNNAPTVDAVSRGVLDQVRWERDVAIKQLEDHGIPFGGIAPDVVKVVRCKDCVNCYAAKLRSGKIYFYKCLRNDIEVEVDDFCSYGERRTDNG